MSVNFLQHVDENIKPSQYNHLNNDELLVTSIFYTLQGEGPFGGYPSVFLRLAGCNIGSKKICDFCDTKFHFHLGKRLSFNQILKQISELAQGKTKLIVITGGEPFLQKNVTQFVEQANLQGYQTQFETNGLLYREIPKTYNNINNTVVCSPKMAGTEYGNLHPQVFERASILKFVVEKNGKFNTIPSYAFDFVKTGRQVYISPINVYLREVKEKEIPSFFTPGLFNIEACKENYKYAGELCLKHGFILNIQKHLFIGVE